MIKKRNIVVCFLLSFITLGIYGIYLYYTIGEDTRKLCADDGMNQLNYVYVWLLGFVTFGIFPICWCCTTMNRLRMKAKRNGMNKKMYSDVSYAVWNTIGILIIVGPIIAFHHFVAQINCFAEDDAAPADNHGGSGKVPPLNPNPPQKPIIDNNDVDAAPPTAPLTDNPFGKFARTGVVICESGMYQGARFSIKEGEELVIGTNAGLCNIIIDNGDDAVSAKHCSIEFNAGANNYTVVDYSTNGTFLRSGERLINNAPKILPVGELLIIGDAKNTFRVG